MAASGAFLSVEIHLPLTQFPLACTFEAQREVVVLFGASGAGKTSVLDCIAGFRKPFSGRITLGDRVVFCSERGINLPPRLRRVGYLSQQPALFPHLSVRQNVEYGLLDLPQTERDARVSAILERFHIAALAASRPAAISGGEQQRVALARTLVCEPELLLLDEPLSALDLRLKSLLLETLFDWQRERAVPMLYVTHEQSEAYSLSRRVLVLEKGSVVADGEPQRIFNSPISRERAELSGYENIFDAVVEEAHPALGTMTCRITESNLLLEAPLANRTTGEAACLALRAGDILVAVNCPSGISARNLLHGRIRAVEDRAGMIELRVQCAAGGARGIAQDGNTRNDASETEFCVHITRGALQNLALQPGQAVWLIIKTHSIQFLRS
jgi:molybdenum ABC transporter ATP-binding protein